MPAAILRASSKLKNGFYEFQAIRKKIYRRKIRELYNLFYHFLFQLM